MAQMMCQSFCGIKVTKKKKTITSMKKLWALTQELGTSALLDFSVGTV
jgi:hypothetical protein